MGRVRERRCTVVRLYALTATAFLLLGVCLVAVSVAGDRPESDSYELRTWAVVSGAPEGDPLVTSTSYSLRSRIGGPFVGSAENTSYALWGCSAYTPVDAVFFASTTEPLCVTLRWTVAALSGISGFHIHRSDVEMGPFERITIGPLTPENPGVYEDRSVLPQTEYWYELWVVEDSGSEYCASQWPASAMTGGRYVTRFQSFTRSPFREQTGVAFEIGEISGTVELTLYDVSGKLVRTLVSEPLSPGRYEIAWDGRNEAGQRLASGVYFCRFEAGDLRETASVVLLK
ncbi:hypothetical protein H8D79_00915 [PVC group bacterium]|nr:hypothetical protein [PVC group bacterium]